MALTRLALSVAPRRLCTTIVASNPRIRITTMISIKVKPASVLRLSLIALTSWTRASLDKLIKLGDRHQDGHHHEQDNTRHHDSHRGLEQGGHQAERGGDLALVGVGRALQQSLQFAG